MGTAGHIILYALVTLPIILAAVGAWFAWELRHMDELPDSYDAADHYGVAPP